MCSNHMGVSENRDTPKWMVYDGKLIKMDDLGVPLFSETAIYYFNLLYLFTSNLFLLSPKLPKHLLQRVFGPLNIPETANLRRYLED